MKFWLQQFCLVDTLSLPLWSHPALGAVLALSLFALAEGVERCPWLPRHTYGKLQADPPPPRPEWRDSVVC